MKNDGYADHVAMGEAEYAVEVWPHPDTGWCWEVTAQAYNLESEEEETHTVDSGWAAFSEDAIRNADVAMLRARSEATP